jgi:hypothetical protein
METFVSTDVLDRIAFLRKGDRFMLVNTYGNQIQSRTGVTTMDGHAVSKNFGWVNGSHFYDAPSKNYINVRYDNPKTPYSGIRTNESLYQLPGEQDSIYGKSMTPWPVYGVSKLYVDRDTLARINREAVMTPEQLHPELLPDPKVEVKAEIARIEQAMKDLSVRLEKARGNL